MKKYIVFSLVFSLLLINLYFENSFEYFLYWAINDYSPYDFYELFFNLLISSLRHLFTITLFIYLWFVKMTN